jgi:hypothetical protein
MKRYARLPVLVLGVALGVATAVNAQTAAAKWSADAATGWDNSISGNINSGATGVLNGQSVVILKNSYEDVYGTGLHLRFGGGYMWNQYTELRGSFTFQSLDADLTPIGDIGASKLYAQYADYQSFGFDVGLRRYANIGSRLQPYGEGTLGLAFIDETDVKLVAPSVKSGTACTGLLDPERCICGKSRAKRAGRGARPWAPLLLLRSQPAGSLTDMP